MYLINQNYICVNIHPNYLTEATIVKTTIINKARQNLANPVSTHCKRHEMVTKWLEAKFCLSGGCLGDELLSRWSWGAVMLRSYTVVRVAIVSVL